MDINTHCIMDGGNKYSIHDTSIFKLNPILDELTNREVRCSIKTLFNSTITGVFTIQIRHGEIPQIQLLAYPGLNFHPMCADIRFTMADIMRLNEFKITVLR